MSAAPEERYEVGDLDPAGVLAEAERVEVESRRIEIRRLELAYQWAVLHPATAETGVETPGGPALGVLDAEETLGGDGTPGGGRLRARVPRRRDGVDAGRGPQPDRRRPRPHPPSPQAVEAGPPAGQVPAWQARRVAQQTHRLPQAGARWVDEQLADRIGCGPVITDRLVAQAAATYDPEDHADREDQARRLVWDVKLTHPSPTEFAGTSATSPPTATP